MDDIDERVRRRAKRRRRGCVVRGKAERVTVREIRGGGGSRVSPGGGKPNRFPANTGDPFPSPLYVRVREGTNPNKNKRTTFRLSVRFCCLGAVLVIVGLCSLISHGRRAGESPTKEWRRLEKSSSGKISHYLLSAREPPPRIRNLFAPKPCVPVTHTDWSASIRITASRLQVSVPILHRGATTRAISSLLPAFAASLATDGYLTSGSPWTGRPTSNHVFSSRRLQNRCRSLRCRCDAHRRIP